jgi:quinol-cytochrome oxidoreductase complex cytochrome b subunit
LLTVVKSGSIQDVKAQPVDKVHTWPHLLRPEFVMAMLLSVFLFVVSVFIRAPLEEMANPAVTPHVAKAPWYFLGLQELLSYFNTTVAGVLVVPVYLGGLLIVPYIDRSPYKAIRDRKFIWVLFMSLMIGGLIVTFIGSFFRGPGWNWVWPWDGLYFTL